jgi:hypothetical protein
MSRLGGSVDTDIIIIDGVMMGDRVIMGDCKFRGFGVGCDVGGWLGRIVVGGDMVKSNLISLRFCVWLGGVIEVLQLEGVGQHDVVIVVIGSRWGHRPPVLIIAMLRSVALGW